MSVLVHGIKANLKTDAIISRLLERFPDGVPLEADQDAIGQQPVLETSSQRAPKDKPAAVPANTAARKHTMRGRSKPKAEPTQDPVVATTSGPAMPVAVPEAEDPMRESPCIPAEGRSVAVAPATRISSASKASHSDKPPARVSGSGDAPKHPSEARDIPDLTTSTDPFADSSAPAWLLPVLDPDGSADANAGWTPSPIAPIAPIARSRPPSRPLTEPATAQIDPKEPRATEEQVRTIVGVMADISKKHKERWREVNAYDERVAALPRTLQNLRTLVRQERAHRVRMQNFLAYWNPVGPEWRDEEIWDRVRPTKIDDDGHEVEVLSDEEDPIREEYPLPPGAKATEIVERRVAYRRDSEDRDVRVSEVLDLTADRRLAPPNSHGKKRRCETPVGEVEGGEQRGVKRARRLETPAKTRGNGVPVKTLPVMGAITEDGEE
ncbi:hypothetical protein BC628DRAFT_1501969 [Trametes gibbosa]|nr:hypothetical protein BC628DRAFT_1501969 [Trametes gibbosa]